MFFSQRIVLLKTIEDVGMSVSHKASLARLLLQFLTLWLELFVCYLFIIIILFFFFLNTDSWLSCGHPPAFHSIWFAHFPSQRAAVICTACQHTCDSSAAIQNTTFVLSCDDLSSLPCGDPICKSSPFKIFCVCVAGFVFSKPSHSHKCVASFLFSVLVPALDSPGRENMPFCANNMSQIE